MYFRISLDGTVYTEPMGTEKLSITLERDKTVKGLIRKYTNKLTFVGDGYTYLRQVRDLYGVCYQVEATVEYRSGLSDPWNELFTGIINVSDIRFTLFPYGTAETTIEDNAWTSLINNNKSIKAHVEIGRSKNDTTITPAPAYQVNMFDSSTGVYTIKPYLYRVDDCFRFLIDFMTDGQVGYSSPLFGVGGDLEWLFIGVGSNVSQTTTTAAPYISFVDLFQEMDKKFNISFRITYSSGSPTMVIDRTENIFTSATTITLDNPDRVEESYDKDELFSRVKLGNSQTRDFDGVASLFPDNQFIGFRSEEYHLLGQCNIDRELNLEGGWIYDSNIINETVVNSLTDWDDEIFVVMADNNPSAVQYDTFNPGVAPYYYNMNMVNSAVAENYLGGIPNAIAEFLNLNSNSFKSVLTADVLYSAGTSVIIWDTDLAPDGYDPGNNYNTTNGRYTAPQNGVYDFHSVFGFAIDPGIFIGLPIGTLLATVYFRHYTAGGTLISSVTMGTITVSPIPYFGLFGNAIFYMSTGEYVRMEINAVYGGITITSNAFFGKSTFNAGAAPDEGGVFYDYDPNDFRIINFDFDYPLTLSEINSIIANETDVIAFTNGGRTFNGWLKRGVFNLWSGFCEFTLLNKNIIEL